MSRFLWFTVYMLRLRCYKAKLVKTRCYQQGIGQFEPRFQGKGSSRGNIFWFLQNQTHFAIRQCKLHRATYRRFDTIPACADGRTDGQADRQTDGIAVASTALAMRALRRAVKTRRERETKLIFHLLAATPHWAIALIFGTRGDIADVNAATPNFVVIVSSILNLRHPSFDIIHRLSWSPLQQCKHCRDIL